MSRDYDIRSDDTYRLDGEIPTSLSDQEDSDLPTTPVEERLGEHGFSVQSMDDMRNASGEFTEMGSDIIDFQLDD